MKTFLLYAVAVLIWGSTWFAIKLQLTGIPSQVSLLYRFGLAAMLLFLWCRLRRVPIRFSPREHLLLLLAGLSVFSTNYILLYEAERELVSGSVAIIFSLLVIFNILNMWFFFGQRPGYAVLASAALGLIGIALTFWQELHTLGSTPGNGLGIVLGLAGTLCASLGNMVFAKMHKRGIPVVSGNAFGMLYGTVLLLIYAWITGGRFSFDFSPSYILSLFYLSLFGSVIAFGCYLALVGRIGADRAAYVSIMFPIVALVLSTIFEGYRLNLLSGFGIILVLAGNALILLQKQRAKSGTVTESSVDGSALRTKGQTA
ncbi:MAG: EamA family transporter [Verrucomicrobia bacterium]|nr:EamA family transporter [Verrucomicrobiota bacterium]